METQTGKEMKNTMNGAHKKAQNMMETAEQTVSSMSVQDLRETLESAMNSVRENSRMAVDRTETWIKANPYKALFGAVTVGAVIASFMRRGKH